MSANASLGSAFYNDDEIRNFIDCWCPIPVRAYIARLAAGAAANSTEIPDDLFLRIEAAISRITHGEGAMRVPADKTDPDLVLAECRDQVAALQRQLATLRAAPAAEGAAPEHGSWIAADDVRRHVRTIDVALNGEEGAAKQAALCDITSQVSAIARRVGPILPAFARIEAENRRLSAPAAAPAPVDGLAFAELRALVNLLMCSDPWPVQDLGEGDGRDELVAVADREARRAGYGGWLDAFHDTRPLAAPTSAATPGEAAHGEQGDCDA